ncbi:MAG: TonB-dependent receptor domain-containing protein [Bryobacteraceae bacterium]
MGLALSAGAQTGEVRSEGQPIPGATVTAQQGDKKLVTTTDENGRYSLEGLTPGAWTLQVEMFGFAPAKREMQVGAAPVNLKWNLELKAATPPPSEQAAARARPRGQQRGGGFQSLSSQVDTQIDAAMAANNGAEMPQNVNSGDANESFLINGSLTQGLQNTGAPSPELQLGGRDRFGGGMGGDGEVPPGLGAQAGGGGFGGRGGGFGGGGRGGGFGGGFRGRGGRGRGPGRGEFFGNRANRARDQLHGMVSFSLGNSVANARPFSLTGQDITEPSYAQSRFSMVLGGPLIIPKIVKSPNTFFFLSYFGTRSRNPQKFVETVPTAAERGGDFSGTGAAIYDAFTGVPFSGNVIPQSRLNPIALRLLPYIPLPNQPGTVQNYQFLTANPQDTDNFSLRLNQNLTRRDRLALNLHIQRRDSANAQPYGYSDNMSGFGASVTLSYTRNIGAQGVNVAQAQFNRNSNRTAPFFAGKTDVAQQLGIQGTSPDPVNFGPPTLSFTNFGSLSDGTYAVIRNQTMGGTESFAVPIGQHNLSFGGNLTRSQLNNLTDQNGRGSFSFTGLSTSALDANGNPASGTGFDFADYLLGFPQTSSIRYGTASTYFRGSLMGMFAQDDWRVLPNLSLNFGLRYEYVTPYTEKYGHIANLDIAPYFTGAASVVPGQSGPYTGAFPASLIDPDRHDWAPRVALAWKPMPKKSLVIRAGYGLYYVPNAYNQFMSALASEPPWATTNSLSTSLQGILTLASGFTLAPPGKTVTNSYAVDRYYKMPYAHSWNFSLQQDLPAAMVLELSYRGTKGTRLNIARSPNSAPPGSPLTAEERRQIGDAVGFTYYSSDGNSIYNALQVRVMRRFRRGVSFNLNYTFSKSIDDSSTFGGAGNTVAQDPNDLAAERGLSSFDQRHRLTGNLIWTSPVGGTNGLLAGKPVLERLLKDWTFSTSLTAASGTPLTARVLGNRADSSGTGTVGAGRAEATGLPIEDASGFFNPAAFTLPPLGAYGNAGRNTIPGPGAVTLNASFGRSITLAERKRLEFRIESTNVLNHVNYTNLETVVNAVDYGLPLTAGQMRTMQAVVRFRF